MIKTRRWDDPQEPDDGTRILVTRYRPRGLRREDETWHEWKKGLGPSTELHAAVYGKAGGAPISWSEYANRYKREMLHSRSEITRLAERVAAGEQITLRCSSHCTSENRCHRSILRDLIQSEIQRLSKHDHKE